jgi:Caspase domain/Protein of unknown function (DUF1566)
MNVWKPSMKKIRYFIFGSLSFILLFPFYAVAERGLYVKPISPSGIEVIGAQWLFVIGIDTYIHWPRLKTAVNDAKALKKVLLSRYYFDKDHLIELYDDQASEKNIIAKLRYLAKKVGRDDSLVIFYAGHGHLDSITKEGSWIPVESGTRDASSWITNHDIKNYLRIDAIKAKHILLISDSCFAGDFFRGQRGKIPKVTEKVVKKAYKLSSRQAITSGGLEPVSDAGFGNNSVFSHFLVNTLNENREPFLVPSDIFPYIKAGVAENSEQFPQFGSLMDTGGQQGGELVLFLKQKSRLKELFEDASQKSQELERLKQLEQESREAKREETAEILKRERVVAALDAKIAEMKKNLGTVAADTDDSLDAILVMIEQKEKQQKTINDLRNQQEVEEANRRAEIAHLKKEREQKRIASIEADITKYEKIVSSPYGKGMNVTAWKILADKYPEAKGLEVGDIEKLYIKTCYGFQGKAFRDPFKSFASGVVYDKTTGLEWYAGPDKATNWFEAKKWVESLNVAGGGWRMPTREELKTLYKKGVGERNMTPLMKNTGWWVWSGEITGSSEAWLFYFIFGRESTRSLSDSNLEDGRGFAVRSRRQ